MTKPAPRSMINPTIKFVLLMLSAKVWVKGLAEDLFCFMALCLHFIKEYFFKGEDCFLN